MGVGQDVAVAADNEAGALAPGRRRLPVRDTEAEAAEEFIERVVRRKFRRAFPSRLPPRDGRDVDHRAAVGLHQRREVRQPAHHDVALRRRRGRRGSRGGRIRGAARRRRLRAAARDQDAEDDGPGPAHRSHRHHSVSVSGCCALTAATPASCSHEH